MSDDTTIILYLVRVDEGDVYVKISKRRHRVLEGRFCRL